MENGLQQIGRVVATEAKPSTAYSFSFWTADDSKVGIGTLVVVATEKVEVFGVVVEGFGFHPGLLRGRRSSDNPDDLPGIKPAQPI